MSWFIAGSWLFAMNASNNGAGYLGFNDWRLPSSFEPDGSRPCQGTGIFGFNCTGSEMGHLFYTELGGVTGQSIATTHNANYDLFTNIQPFAYWSGQEYLNYTTGGAWYFRFFDGGQGIVDKRSSSEVLGAAWAVRDGDVAAVPAPGAAWLLGTALMGWLGLVRRKAMKLALRVE